MKLALESVARFSDTLGTRDAKLRQLLADANKVTSVLAKRSDQIAQLVVNTDALLGEILSQRNSVEMLMTNVSAATVQLSGLVNDNPDTKTPFGSQDSSNGVLGILDNRKKELQRTLYLLRRYAMSFGEVLGAGPFFKASLVNLFPGQFDQPFVDAAFSDFGLGPQRAVAVAADRARRRSAGYSAAAVAVSPHRPGQTAESHAARCDHREILVTRVTPIVSHCPRRRPVVRRPDLRRWLRPQVRCHRRRSSSTPLPPSNHSPSGSPRCGVRSRFARGRELTMSTLRNHTARG